MQYWKITFIWTQEKSNIPLPIEALWWQNEGVSNKTRHLRKLEEIFVGVQYKLLTSEMFWKKRKVELGPTMSYCLCEQIGVFVADNYCTLSRRTKKSYSNYFLSCLEQNCFYFPFVFLFLFVCLFFVLFRYHNAMTENVNIDLHVLVYWWYTFFIQMQSSIIAAETRVMKTALSFVLMCQKISDTYVIVDGNGVEYIATVCKGRNEILCAFQIMYM